MISDIIIFEEIKVVRKLGDFKDKVRCYFEHKEYVDKIYETSETSYHQDSIIDEHSDLGFEIMEEVGLLDEE